MIPIYVSNWPDADFIITTRLDSDDSLAKNCVFKIQECMPDAIQRFKKWKTQKCSPKYYYIDPVQGHQVDRHSDDPKKWKFYAYRYETNPFMSMIEPFNDKILTIYWKSHTELIASSESFVKQINDIMWMQIIHDNNYTNRLGYKQKQTSPDLYAFPWLSKYLPSQK